MDQLAVEGALSGLPLGGVRFYPSAGSTNDLAREWAADGAPDAALVLADEQTAGRGRMSRRWFTPPGSALAISLVLRPQSSQSNPAYLTALGALAVCESLREDYGLSAAIKWPNDVLIMQPQVRKVAGILVEALWQGQDMQAAIVGIGVNVAQSAVPQGVALNFPASSIETALGRPVERLELLRQILGRLLNWRARLASPEFLAAWDEQLAFRNQPVIIRNDAGEERHGILLGLEDSGALRLRSEDGSIWQAPHGELHLRPH